MMKLAALLCLVSLYDSGAVNFLVENHCDFTANVQMQMGGENTMISNGFTLSSGAAEQLPVDSTTPLSGTFYVANSLPATLAEFQLRHGQNRDTDLYSINLSRGANVGVAIAPTSPNCKSLRCHARHCASKLVSCPSGGDYVITFCP